TSLRVVRFGGLSARTPLVRGRTLRLVRSPAQLTPRQWRLAGVDILAERVRADQSPVPAHILWTLCHRCGWPAGNEPEHDQRKRVAAASTIRDWCARRASFLGR